METDWASVKSELASCGQEHLLQFLDELTESEKAELYGDIRDIDLGRVARYFGVLKAALVDDGEKKDEVLKPPDSSICGSTARDVEDAKRWENIGLCVRMLICSLCFFNIIMQ